MLRGYTPRWATPNGAIPTEIASVVEKIQGLMAEYELTVEDIAPKRGRGRPAGTAGKQGRRRQKKNYRRST